MYDSMTTLQAIAETVYGKIIPMPSDAPKVDIEDLVDDARDFYTGYIFEQYGAQKNSGDNQLPSGVLSTKTYPVGDSNSIQLDGIQVIDLPRDYGMYQVIGVGDENNVIGKPYTKSNPAMAGMGQSRINPGRRVYRIGEVMHFPDGHADCTSFIRIVFVGMLLDDEENIYVPREQAGIIKTRLYQIYLPTQQVPVDETNNDNRNA